MGDYAIFRTGIIILTSLGTIMTMAAFGSRVEAAQDHTAVRTMSVTTDSRSFSDAQTSVRWQAEP